VSIYILVFVFVRKEMSYDNDFEDAKFRYSESLREKLGVVDRYSLTLRSSVE
jgi:hypothetical protein